MDSLVKGPGPSALSFAPLQVLGLRWAYAIVSNDLVQGSYPWSIQIVLGAGKGGMRTTLSRPIDMFWRLDSPADLLGKPFFDCVVGDQIRRV